MVIFLNSKYRNKYELRRQRTSCCRPAVGTPGFSTWIIQTARRIWKEVKKSVLAIRANKGRKQVAKAMKLDETTDAFWVLYLIKRSFSPSIVMN